MGVTPLLQYYEDLRLLVRRQGGGCSTTPYTAPTYCNSESPLICCIGAYETSQVALPICLRTCHLLGLRWVSRTSCLSLCEV